MDSFIAENPEFVKWAFGCLFSVMVLFGSVIVALCVKTFNGLTAELARLNSNLEADRLRTTP